MDPRKTSMTEGTIWKILVRFALPLLLGNLFQQFYNMVDSLVVGNFCGDQALAAVSSSNSLCHLIIGFFQGVFIGASVIISHRYGAKDDEGVDRAIHTTVLFALVIGVLLSIFGVCFTPTILQWMGTPENVLPNSILYFRVYCAGLLALVLYNTATGIFQALGDSRHPLYYLIIASVANIILDLLFVGVFGWGVGGAAFATLLGQLLSAILGFAHLMSGRFIVTVRLDRLKADLSVLKEILRLGLPSGFQNSVIAIANLVVQSNINAFGDVAMAGCGSFTKVEGFVFLPIMALTNALTTFVGQNLGAGRLDRVRTGVRQGLIMTVTASELVGILSFTLAPTLIGLFSPSAAVVAYGVRHARTVTLFYCLLGFSHGTAAVLRGAGHSVTPMVIFMGIWCFFRICYVTAMVHFFQTITVVFTAYPVTWCLSSILFAIVLLRGQWMTLSPWTHHQGRSN